LSETFGIELKPDYIIMKLGPDFGFFFIFLVLT